MAFESKRIVPWRLPQNLGRPGPFGVSAHYGLIAWGEEFYQVGDVSEETPVYQKGWLRWN